MDSMQTLTDHQEITDLVAALAHWLDGRGGEPAAIFDPEVVAHSPRGDLRGIEQLIARAAQSADTDERTQHFNTDVLVTQDGDTAVVQANQLVQFFRPGEPPHRTSGLQTEYGMARRADGWRITGVDVSLEWLIGDMPT